MPKKRPKRRRPWLNDDSCIRLRPQFKDHVWSYDFVIARTAEGRVFRILNIIDEYTRECLAILVERCITLQDVIDQLFQLIISLGYRPPAPEARMPVTLTLRSGILYVGRSPAPLYITSLLIRYSVFNTRLQQAR